MRPWAVKTLERSLSHSHRRSAKREYCDNYAHVPADCDCKARPCMRKAFRPLTHGRAALWSSIALKIAPAIPRTDALVWKRAPAMGARQPSGDEAGSIESSCSRRTAGRSRSASLEAEYVFLYPN